LFRCGQQYAGSIVIITNILRRKAELHHPRIERSNAERKRGQGKNRRCVSGSCKLLGRNREESRHFRLAALERTALIFQQDWAFQCPVAQRTRIFDSRWSNSLCFDKRQNFRFFLQEFFFISRFPVQYTVLMMPSNGLVASLRRILQCTSVSGFDRFQNREVYEMHLFPLEWVYNPTEL
jgi:hypothetical protein